MIYTFVGALRSFFPKKDVERICMINSVLSYPAFGRTIATIAEIAFSQFIVYVFKGISNYTLKYTGQNTSFLHSMVDLLVPMITIAQMFCWSGCLTTNSFFNVIEESIWTISSLIIILFASYLYSNLDVMKQNGLSDNKISSLKTFLTYFIIFTGIYFIFMIKVDVPMYYKRYQEYKLKNHNHLSFYDSFKDMCQCKEVTKDFNIWKHEMPWKTGYFVVGVYSTILITKWFYSFTK